MNLTPNELRAALEKHGLPIWGTDAELATRYERNFKPVAVAAKPKVAVAISDGNRLLANRAGIEAPKTPAELYADGMPRDEPVVELTSENAHIPVKTVDYIPSEVRRPGRPPKIR